MSQRLCIVVPIIHDHYIYKAVETLYKYTDNFSLIIVDQTIDGLPMKWVDKNVHLYIRQKNMGFSNAMNKGFIMGLRHGFEYLMGMNDDVEFMYAGWFEDLLEEFKTDPHILGVNPESPRVPLWGYGRPSGEDIDLIEYKEQYTPEDIAWLKQGDYLEGLKKRYEIEPVDLPDGEDDKKDWGGKIYIPIERRGDNPSYQPHGAFVNKRGVIDGFAGWMPVFKREGLIELGLFDERFVWGGGEDYDMAARAYTCAWPIERDVCDPKYHRRLVSTMKSWVWHHWGKSKDVKAELDERLFEYREPWNDLNYLWPPSINQGRYCDPWGHPPNPSAPDAPRVPLKRIPEVYVHPLEGKK